MRLMKPSTDCPPVMFFVFLGVVALGAVLACLPSEVETSYSWYGVVGYCAFVFGLAGGSNVCRWMLFCLGIFWAVAVASLLTEPIDVVGMAWALTALVGSLILWSPSLRRYTAQSPTKDRSRV